MKIKTSIILGLILLSMTTFGQSVKIPFEFYKSKFVLIKLRMNNDKDSLCFYFDTGATTTLIDSTKASELEIKPNYQQAAAGGTKTYQISLSQSVNLPNNDKINGIHVVIADLTRLQKKLGRKIDGIIGHSILNAYKTKIDFDNQVIELYPLDAIIDTREYNTIDFLFGNNIPIPQFPITIELKNGKKFTENVFFNSGTGLTLLVNSPYKIKHNLTEEIGNTITRENDNLTSKSIQQDGTIKSLQIGKYTLGERTISLSSYKEGVSSYENYLGILGNEIISRFNIITDYSTNKIYIKPNSFFNKPFEFDVSGIELSLENDKPTVSNIIKESQAFKEGIRKGDIIISINGIENNNLEVYKELLKKENSEVSIKYKDKLGNIKSIKLKLKRLV